MTEPTFAEDVMRASVAWDDESHVTGYLEFAVPNIEGTCVIPVTTSDHHNHGMRDYEQRSIWHIDLSEDGQSITVTPAIAFASKFRIPDQTTFALVDSVIIE